MNVMFWSPLSPRRSADQLGSRLVRFDHRRDAVIDIARRNRHAVVVQDRSQPALLDAGLEDQQRAQLRITVLLHYEIGRVRLQELLDLLTEREAAYAHVVGLNPLRLEALTRFLHGTIAAAERHDTDRHLLTAVDDRFGHQ